MRGTNIGAGIFFFRLNENSSTYARKIIMQHIITYFLADEYS